MVGPAGYIFQREIRCNHSFLEEQNSCAAPYLATTIRCVPSFKLLPELSSCFHSVIHKQKDACRSSFPISLLHELRRPPLRSTVWHMPSNGSPVVPA